MAAEKDLELREARLTFRNLVSCDMTLSGNAAGFLSSLPCQGMKIRGVGPLATRQYWASCESGIWNVHRGCLRPLLDVLSSLIMCQGFNSGKESIFLDTLRIFGLRGSPAFFRRARKRVSSWGLLVHPCRFKHI